MPNIIDPHKAFDPNNIPDLSQMTISVELFVYRRNRTVINKQYDGLETIQSKGESVAINYLGYDKATKSFTTKWTQNQENFGITNINIKINSSYVPQVDMDFIDVRGQSLLSQAITSDYSSLYEFPPPIFKLVVKGFYGMATEYFLHLVSQATKFNSGNGNFEIKANFIGLTFAPLADIKLGYLTTIPYILKETSGINLDDGVQNTAELRVAIQQLQSNLKKVVETDYNKFDEKRRKISDIDKLISDEFNINKIITELSNEDSKTGKYERISNTEVIKIYIPVKEGRVINSDIYKNVKILIDNRLNILRDNQININNVKLKPIKPEIDYNREASKQLAGSYVTYDMDLTDIIKKLNEQRTKLVVEVEEKAKNLEKNINDITEGTLKFKPTIKNVFKLLTDDCDKFINKINEVSNDAEKESSSRFPSEGVITANEIKFSWPYYTAQQSNKIGNINTKIKKIPEHNDWAEVKFVDQFIDAQIASENNIKQSISGIFEKDSDGNYKWIPLNPMDSPIIANKHPYSTVNSTNDIYDLLVRRALLLINDTYRSINDINFFKQYSNGEALNIVGGLANVNKNLQKLKEDSKNKLDITTIETPFLTNIFKDKSSVSELGNTSKDFIYNFKNELIDIKTQEDFLLVNSFNNEDGGEPKKRIETTNPSGKVAQNIEEYVKDELESNFLVKFFNKNKDFDIVLSQYNVPFIEDVKFNNKNSDSANDGGSDLYNSSFKYNELYTFDTSGGSSKRVGIYNANTINFITKTPETFLFYLTKKQNKNYTNTPISIPNFISVDRFKKPSIIEIPLINLIYYGYKSYIVDSVDNNGYFTATTYNSVLNGKAIVAFSDKNDVSLGENINESLIFNNKTLEDNITEFNFFRNLPQEIRDKFKKYFEEYYNGFFLSDGIQSLMTNDVVTLNDDKYFDNNGTATDKYKQIWEKLYKKEYIIIGNDNVLTNQTNFNPANRNNLVKDFVNDVIAKLSPFIEDKEKEIKKEKDTLNSRLNDIDVRTEVYYNFKNFNDRWITDFNIFKEKGGINDEPLINKFLFVDRGMNDIGDEIVLDLSPLLNESLDSSLYTVILNLLVKNGFEFFPMQNFLNFDDGRYNWTDDNIKRIFGTHVNERISGNPRFICMYVGGNSSQLEIDNSNFENDGVNLNGNQANIPAELANVKAFLVNFGTGNQSFFKSLSLDQSEYKETNESINILDRIAKSGAEPTPIGQSLFNTYEQRSYTCSVECVGNMMIQPTMYFQLDNVKLWRGAYLILEVNHSISAPALMTTTFKGVRIPKATKPKVTRIATVAGYDLTITKDNTDAGINPLNTNNGNVNAKNQKIELFPVIDNDVLNKFKNPIDNGIITSNVNSVRTNLGQNNGHGGIDIGVNIGNPVYSVLGGKVIQSKLDEKGYGYYLIIDHDKQNDDYYYYSLYAHLSKRLKNINDIVSVGEKIGESGNSGHSTGSHLHFELKRSKVKVDVNSYFNSDNIVVLNPSVILKEPFNSNPQYSSKQQKQHGDDKTPTA